MKTCRCIVHGRVQGVGYRFWTVRTALPLKLTGWVRNLPDGSVELTATGAPDAIGKLQEHLWQGPAYSEVTAVSCTDLPTSDEASTDFSIRY
ncbi:acylphosphatase [Desulfovibrio mangrovi]|uniref:acylphosphatase n=1 Tax=Desulfovibrio mangrovi TaxID=2976983 RepID=UPI002248239D|nr:acylphosphatase [Desulfovibrio mangrovi]UZP67747.1 acylphosphatase [Desulfovibrio mangrovi]